VLGDEPGPPHSPMPATWLQMPRQRREKFTDEASTGVRTMIRGRLSRCQSTGVGPDPVYRSHRRQG
jgi:hypothetical protein